MVKEYVTFPIKIISVFFYTFLSLGLLAQSTNKTIVETYGADGNIIVPKNQPSQEELRKRFEEQEAKKKMGNAGKVETRIGEDGKKQTVIKLGPVLNRPFNPDTIDPNHVVIQIYKKHYRMYVYYKGNFLTAYNCVFGTKPIGQKLYEGDKRTPEGWFTITDVRNNSKWERFIELDYPNLESRKNHEQAKAEGRIPASSRIGGNVGIHGVWAGGDNVIESRFNWTDGCIALTNQNVIQLAKIVKPGTRVYVGYEN